MIMLYQRTLEKTMLPELKNVFGCISGDEFFTRYNISFISTNRIVYRSVEMKEIRR